MINNFIKLEDKLINLNLVQRITKYENNYRDINGGGTITIYSIKLVGVGVTLNFKNKVVRDNLFNNLEKCLCNNEDLNQVVKVVDFDSALFAE